MRQTLLLIVGLIIGCTVQAKNRVIEEPPFCVRNTTSIEVSKIILSDTATVLHIYAKYRPKNWIRIASESYLQDNNGETYLLRSGIGITPGKQFWMPESGEAEFQLVFPPLPAKVTSIDFTEGEGVEGAFSIWGIQLKSKELPKLMLPQEAVAHPIDKNAALPAPLVQYGNTTVKGKLLDYRPCMMKELSLYLSEPSKGYADPIKAEIKRDGSFNITFPVMGTTAATINLLGTDINFFVEPEQTSELYINLREISRKKSTFHKSKKPYGEIVYINGPLAGLSEELNRNRINTDMITNYQTLIKEIRNMDIAAYKTYMLDKAKDIQQKIDNASLSQSAKQLLSLEKELNIIQTLTQAPWLLTQAALQQKKLQRNESEAYFKKLDESLPADYIPTETLKHLNIPQAILVQPYLYAINVSARRQNDYVRRLGTDKGVFFDIARTTLLYQSIKDFTPLTDTQKVEITTLPDAYQRTLQQANEQLLQLLENNKKKSGFTINEAGEVSNEDLFPSIIGKFKGKVLLVDFWATWCGPCRMANKVMAPMKEELKDKDIVYLYITGEVSPQKTWENMIPDIHGEHYRLTNAQWEYLSKSFGIRGVPTYLIIDRKGDIKFKQTGFPGVEKMKEELLKVTD
ncbi:TlpA family protein disulfide reductase [Phocaeicola sp.]|jgi:thiol-disulfide isomerase/thioredoxin|uniref:TlpA family protein disulfide reductase n=1 Tax=Phocaeicola sp. TaxID=2773926 RepID=UPI003A8E99C7